MKIKPSGRAGFTLTEVMIVVGIVGLLAEIAIPNFMAARGSARTRTCIANLRQIDDAKQQWAFEELRSLTTVPTSEHLAPYFFHGSIETVVFCPLDTSRNFDNSYDPKDLTEVPECRLEPLVHVLPY